MSEPKTMPAAEFRRDGYLQEVNRQFFHPLGLALGVDETDNSYVVFDMRDDPEGVIFCRIPVDVARENRRRVADEWVERATTRYDMLGFVVQSVDGMALGCPD